MLRPPVIIVSALIFIFIFFNLGYCQNSMPSRNSRGTSPILDKAKVSLGYTLLVPYDRSKETEEKGKIYLVDLYGKPVHVWETDHTPFHAILKKDGNLVVALITPNNINKGGKTGILQELDWNGNVLWEYKNEELHHDFEILPNGNIAALLNEPVPPTIAKQVKGGTPNTEPPTGMLSDRLIEIDKAGNIVWDWHAYEYLSIKEDVLGPVTPRANWTHVNSIRFTKHDPIENDEAYLVSIRHINKVILIKKSNGKIIWRTPEGLLSAQHDATFLSNGNILIFNNGTSRIPNPTTMYGSTVIEINPKENKKIWEFDGGSTGTSKAKFFASITSGAQRLPNGNTLITLGPAGHVVEVTAEKEIVWDFINPFEASNNQGPWLNNSVFKARRYGADEIAWPEKLSSSLPAGVSACTFMFKRI